MNRGRKPVGKKIDFEPNVLAAQAAVPGVEESRQDAPRKPVAEKPRIPRMMGQYAPVTTEVKSKKFDVRRHGMILHLPKEMEGGSFVVFDDNTVGIKIGEKIYECNDTFIGDGMIVNFGKKLTKETDVDFILTSYPFQSED